MANSVVERWYGLGTASGEVGGWHYFGHSGGFQGFITRTAVFPAHDLALSILTNSADGLANVFLDGAVFPAERWRSRFDLGVDLDESRLDEALFELGYADERGNDLSFGYRFLRDLPKFYEGFRYDKSRFNEFSVNFERINQFDLYGRWTLLRGFAFTYRVQYSLEGHFSLKQQLGVEYVSRCKCWAIRIEGEDQRSRGFEIGVSYRILGVGDDLLRPFDARRRRGQQSLIAR